MNRIILLLLIALPAVSHAQSLHWDREYPLGVTIAATFLAAGGFLCFAVTLFVLMRLIGLCVDLLGRVFAAAADPLDGRN